MYQVALFLLFAACARPGAKGDRCAKSADCTAGLLCIDGKCEAPCQTSNDCANNELCSPGGQCMRAECPGACPAGTVCTHGVCADPSMVSSACKLVSECAGVASGFACLDSGICGCTATSDCPQGSACNVDRACRVSGCDADHPCNGGCCSAGICQDGNLSAACGNGGACADCTASADGRLCTDTGCGCAQASDCPLGTACVGGKCNAIGCTTTDKPCNGGCCDNGACDAGNTKQKCGNDGTVCNSCGTSAILQCENGACTGCMGDNDCAALANTPYCVNQKCVACRGAGDCAAGCCDTRSNTCKNNDATNCGSPYTVCANQACGGSQPVCLGGNCGCTMAAHCPKGKSCNTVTGVCEVSCGPGHTACHDGCCGNGLCRPGDSNAYCGLTGGACATCTGLNACNMTTGVCGNTCDLPHTRPCAFGCCSGGTCNVGNTLEACGKNGLTCDACATDEACNKVAGQCSAVCNPNNPTMFTACSAGCCDPTGAPGATGTCVAGNADDACGIGGNACGDCTPLIFSSANSVVDPTCNTGFVTCSSTWRRVSCVVQPGVCSGAGTCGPPAMGGPWISGDCDDACADSDCENPSTGTDQDPSCSGTSQFSCCDCPNF